MRRDRPSSSMARWSAIADVRWMLLALLLTTFCHVATPQAQQPRLDDPATAVPPPAHHHVAQQSDLLEQSAGAIGYGLGMQMIMSTLSVALLAFSLGTMMYALRVQLRTAKVLNEVRDAAANIQAAAVISQADRLSGILMKMDLAAEATSAAAEAITDAMLADSTKKELADEMQTPVKQTAVNAPPKEVPVVAKPMKDVGDLISMEPSDVGAVRDQDHLQQQAVSKGMNDDITSLPFVPLTDLSDQEDFPDAAASSSVAAALTPSPLVTPTEPNTPGVVTPAAAAGSAAAAAGPTPVTAEFSQARTPHNTPAVGAMPAPTSLGFSMQPIGFEPSLEVAEGLESQTHGVVESELADNPLSESSQLTGSVVPKFTPEFATEFTGQSELGVKFTPEFTGGDESGAIKFIEDVAAAAPDSQFAESEQDQQGATVTQ